jgi:hypothetical protein
MQCWRYPSNIKTLLHSGLDVLQTPWRCTHDTRLTSCAIFNILDPGTLRIAKLLCWRYLSNHKRLYVSRHHTACLTYGDLSHWTQFSDCRLDSLTFFCSLYANTYDAFSRWTRFSDCYIDSLISFYRMPKPMAHYLVSRTVSLTLLFLLFLSCTLSLLFGHFNVRLEIMYDDYRNDKCLPTWILLQCPLCSLRTSVVIFCHQPLRSVESIWSGLLHNKFDDWLVNVHFLRRSEKSSKKPQSLVQPAF